MEKDKKYKRIGWATTAVVQLAMLILFYFLIAWKEPFPPIPTYGIELNFGFQETGAGDDTPQSSQVEPIEQEEAVDPLNEVSEEEVATPEEISSEAVEEQISETPEFEDIQTPDVIEATKAVEEPVKTPKKVIETPKEPAKEPIKKAVEPVKEPVPVQEALMPSNNSNAENKEASQGDAAIPKGDQGKEEGTIDGRAIYGSQGNSEGASLQLAGWTWGEPPKPNDKSLESGEIIYKITIDKDGYLTKIDLDKSTISPDIERVYRQSIDRLTFYKTDDNKPAANSTGYVKFIIKTK